MTLISWAVKLGAPYAWHLTPTVETLLTSACAAFIHLAAPWSVPTAWAIPKAATHSLLPCLDGENVLSSEAEINMVEPP